ncbi:MAG: fatty acid desaturase [Pseudomonadota bacterium]
MDHKAFLRSLHPADKAYLTQRSDAAGLVPLALHFGLIAFFGLWIALGWPAWQLALVPQAFLVTFLFTLEHECTHQTPFASQALSTWVGRIAGFVHGLPFERFRYFHLAHHRFTNDPDNDPELQITKPKTLRAWVWTMSGMANWIWLIRQLFTSAFGTDDAPYIPDRVKGRVRREARLHLTLYAGLGVAMLTVAPWLFWIWVVPSLIGQPALRAYLLAEHAGCDHGTNMFLNTRTTFTSRAIRLLAWNMPFHAEHHTYPAVPFHRLPELHARMRTHLGVTSEGYGAFTRDYLRDMRQGDSA